MYWAIITVKIVLKSRKRCWTQCDGLIPLFVTLLIRILLTILLLYIAGQQQYRADCWESIYKHKQLVYPQLLYTLSQSHNQIYLVRIVIIEYLYLLRTELFQFSHYLMKYQITFGSRLTLIYKWSFPPYFITVINY